jgi:hypothetical protein
MQLRFTRCGWLPFRPKVRGFNQQGIFDKQEIKIVLNYLQLLVDKHDDHAFEYVVNTPARFIFFEPQDPVSSGRGCSGSRAIARCELNGTLLLFNVLFQNR